jgi:hypothetical protein
MAYADPFLDRTKILQTKGYGADAPARDRLQANAKEDYDFYRESFAPQTSELRRIGLGFGAGNQYDAIQSTLPTAGKMFDTGTATFERDRERLGLRDNAAAGSQRKRLGLARVLSQVDSANRASRGARDMREDAQNFGMDSYAQNAVGASGTLRSITGEDMDRDLQYKDAKGRAKSNQMAAGASLAMIAAMMI